MSDLINTQDAIKNAYYDGYDDGYNAGFEAGQRDVMLDKLPSAQTVAKDTNVLSNDMISRQDAIDQLHQSYNLLDAERRLEDMPIVQLEPCDVCEDLEEGDTLYSRSEWDGGIRDYIRDIKFCPKCGRRL